MQLNYLLNVSPSLSLACAQLLLFACNAAPTTAAMLVQLQPSVISALASFFSHSSASICAFSAATCLLIVKRCAGEGAQILHNTGIPGEIEDAVERWRGCRHDGRHASSASICDKVIALLENALQNTNVLCDSSSSTSQVAAVLVQQLRKSGQHVDADRLRSLFVGPSAMSALQLLKTGLPLALSQFLCAENDYSRPSYQYQLDRLVWFFEQMSSASDSTDEIQVVADKPAAISNEACRVFFSELVSLLIDGISSKEQARPSSPHRRSLPFFSTHFLSCSLPP